MSKFKIGDKVWVLLNGDERIGKIFYVMDDAQIYGVELGAAQIYVPEKYLKATDWQETMRKYGVV